WSLPIPGWDVPFRVVMRAGPQGGEVFLGFVDQSALQLLRRIEGTFLAVWMVVLFLGLAVSWLTARRILARVEGITETAAAIGTERLDRRIPLRGGRDEIAQLSRTFNEMLDRIQDSVSQVHTMADALAHDLRSPVTALRGNLELALTRGDPGQLEEAAVGAIDGLDRLLRTLTTSLDLAEADAGALRLHREAVDLQEMSLELVDVYRAAGEEHGLDFEVSARGDTLAIVDPDLTRRALANLLDNTIQHLPAGCHVHVTVEGSGDTVSLGVADDGPGFPPELRSRAFERWSKGASTGGFGIGLALVRSVGQAHGGDAEILDAPGGGAIVRISFPRKPGPVQGGRLARAAGVTPGRG
ncbi:MAG: ATP-binding protein, partial [Acidobacteriota bacterium]